MKKIIFITLIFTLFFTPIFFSIKNDGIKTVFSTVNANKTTPTKTSSVASKTTKVQKNNTIKTTTDKSGITREKCSLTGVFCGMSNALNALMENIALLPIFISSFFVLITGQLLDISILETVIKFGENFNRIGGITDTWSALRDLANIFFIFGLLTIAISTILGLSGYGYKQLLAKLIIVALIINFSLFFTKFVIDASNIFALQFYQEISVADSNGKLGISNTFMQYLGVKDVWQTEGVLKTLNKLNYSTSGGIGLMFLYSVFTSIFLMITAFVFIFASIMLISRAAGFILLAILSPLAFAAMILPKTQGFAHQWWEKLTQYAIFAPALLILFWVVATIIPSITSTFVPGVPGDAKLLNSFSPDPQDRSKSISMIFNFIILIALMLSSIIISNKLSLVGSKKMSNIGKKMALGATNKVVQTSFGSMGAAGRTSFGRMFSKIAQSDKLKKATYKKGLAGIAARFALKTTRAGARGTYDPRGAPGVSSAVGALGVNVGKPQTGGYEAILKKQVEDREKFAKSVGPDEITKAELRKPLEDEKGIIVEQEKETKELKSIADDKVKDIKRRKEILKKEGKEYSPDMEALESELTAEEIKITQTERLIRSIEEHRKDIEEQIKGIGNIKRERAKSLAEVMVNPEIKIFGIKIPILVSRKNKVSYATIMKGKSEKDKMVDALSKKVKTGGGSYESENSS